MPPCPDEVCAVGHHCDGLERCGVRREQCQQIMDVAYELLQRAPMSLGVYVRFVGCVCVARKLCDNDGRIKRHCGVMFSDISAVEAMRCEQIVLRALSWNVGILKHA